MQKVVTAAEMREIDRRTMEDYGIPFLLLMENAAHAAARVIAEKLGGSVAGKSVFVLCGKGNNGGDGAALARILRTQGAKVFVNLFAKVEETKGDAKTNFEILRRQGDVDYYQWNWFEFEQFDSFDEWKRVFQMYWRTNQVDCFVDALFGTGLSKLIEGISSEVIGSFVSLKNNNNNLPLFLSLDLPSGLNADSGELIGANFLADLTVTFTAPKPANVLAPASRYNGELVTVNIGSPQNLIDDSPSQLFLVEKQDAQNWLETTRYLPGSYKGTHGHALIVAGSRNYAGAAVLCGNAAMSSGAGLVTVATPEAAQEAVAARVMPEVITFGLPQTEDGAVSDVALTEFEKLGERANVVAIGSGLTSTDERTRNFVRQAIENRKTPIVIDADGLNALAEFDLQGSDELPIILTPHIGEMKRLLGTDDPDFARDRVALVREFAQKHHVILLLKGERSLIGAPDGRVVINPTGNAGLGTAGSGDTLTGVITGFIAQTLGAQRESMFYTPSGAPTINLVFDAVVAALYISGLAGDIAGKNIGMRAMTASGVREHLSQAFRELDPEGEKP